MSTQHRRSECKDAHLDPETASVQEYGIALLPPGAFTQKKDAWFGIRTSLMCQWWQRGCLRAVISGKWQMNIGWYKKERFYEENNLLNSPAQLHFLTVVLTGPKKILFFSYFVLTLFSPAWAILQRKWEWLRSLDGCGNWEIRWRDVSSRPPASPHRVWSRLPCRACSNRGRLPSHQGTTSKHEHDISAAPRQLEILVLVGVVGLKHG